MLKKIYNSSILNSWFSNLIIVISMLIAIPIVITKLSIEAVNVWFLFATIVSITQGIVLGFSSTFTRFIAYTYAGVSLNEISNLKEKNELSHGSTNLIELEKILNVIKPLYFILSLIFLLLISLVGYLFLSKPISMMDNSAEGWNSWFIVLFSSAIILYLNFYQVFLDGINKVALVQRIIGIVNTFGIFLILAVLFFIPSLFSITLVYQFISIITVSIVAYFSMQNMKLLNLRINIKKFDKKIFLLIWDTAKKSVYTTILASGVKHISSLIVAQLFTATQSASFQFVKRIFDVIERFTATTFQSKVPRLSQLRGQGDLISFSKILRKTQYITYSVFFLGYSIFLFFGDTLTQMIGANIEINNQLIIWFGLSVLITRWAGINLLISNQANNVIEHLAISVSSLIYFIFIFIFIDTLNIYVFPIAQIIAMLVISPFLIKYVYPTFNTNFFKYEVKMIVPISIITLIISVLGIILHGVDYDI